MEITTDGIEENIWVSGDASGLQWLYKENNKDIPTDNTSLPKRREE